MEVIPARAVAKALDREECFWEGEDVEDWAVIIGRSIVCCIFQSVDVSRYADPDLLIILPNLVIMEESCTFSPKRFVITLPFGGLDAHMAKVWPK